MKSVAPRLALACGLTALVGSLLAIMITLRMSGVGQAAARDPDAAERWSVLWPTAIGLAILAAVAVTVVAFASGRSIGSRLTDLGLGLAKIGRGGSEVRMRLRGNDEVGRLGRALQMLATDLAERPAGSDGGDAGLRELRDLSVPRQLPAIDGWELDILTNEAEVGGLTYCGVHGAGDQVVLFLVGADGDPSTAAMVARMASEELGRALAAGKDVPAALAAANRAVYAATPAALCAHASVIGAEGDRVTVWQAGSPGPVLVCRAGQCKEVFGEGLAIGLDDGAVFEQGLRPRAFRIQGGTRLVAASSDALQDAGFVQAVTEHAPKHTAPFSNLVMGAVDSDTDVVLLTVKRQ